MEAGLVDDIPIICLELLHCLELVLDLRAEPGNIVLMGFLFGCRQCINVCLLDDLLEVGTALELLECLL